MTCSELYSNSVPVQVSTWQNKNTSLAEWAGKYRSKSNEHAMGLYQAELTDSDGSSFMAFVGSETIEGGRRHVDISKLKSPIEGWNLTDVIHNHPYGRRSDAFSDQPGDPFGGGDIQVASDLNVNLFLTVKNNDRWIGKFNPSVFSDRLKQGAFREKALKESINSRAIYIKNPTLFE